MGQKVHPCGFRIGVIEPWRSRWYANKRNYGRLLIEDHRIREHIYKEYKSAGVPRIEIHDPRTVQRAVRDVRTRRRQDQVRRHGTR